MLSPINNCDLLMKRIFFFRDKLHYLIRSFPTQSMFYKLPWLYIKINYKFFLSGLCFSVYYDVFLYFVCWTHTSKSHSCLSLPLKGKWHTSSSTVWKKEPWANPSSYSFKVFTWYLNHMCQYPFSNVTDAPSLFKFLCSINMGSEWWQERSWQHRSQLQRLYAMQFSQILPIILPAMDLCTLLNYPTPWNPTAAPFTAELSVTVLTTSKHYPNSNVA